MRNSAEPNTALHNTENLHDKELSDEGQIMERLVKEEKGERLTPSASGRSKLDLEANSISDDIELYMVDELGYNPDSDDFSTAGSVDIIEKESSIGVVYELDEDYTELNNDILEKPLVHFIDDQVIENTIQGRLDYAMVGVENGEKLRVGFSYDKEDYDPASEEVGKAIGWIEQNLPNYEDSGL